jgi:hypothetical protein
MAFVEFARFLRGWGLEEIVIEEVAVVDGDDFSGASGREVDTGFAVGDDCVVGVDEGGGDVGYVVPVGGECGLGFGWVGGLCAG